MVDWKLYRSVILPDPVWKEQALYGGYEWVEVLDGFWVNRRWEAELGIFMKLKEGKLQCHGQCIQEFLDVMVDAGVFANRVCMQGTEIVSKAKYDDYLRVEPVTQEEKAFGALKHYSTLLVYGINESIWKFCEQYGDRFYKILCTEDSPVDKYWERINSTSIQKAHTHQRVLVAKEFLSLKMQISNWSAVVVM